MFNDETWYILSLVIRGFIVSVCNVFINICIHDSGCQAQQVTTAIEY